MTEATETHATVLVVDDNGQNRALAHATLESDGFDVVLARNGEEALTAFEACPPDCVLLDVRMPDLDGFEVCRRIRQLPTGDKVPIIFLTAARDVDTFDAARAAGGDDFITKPVQPAEMSLRVQMALKMRRLDARYQEYFEVARRQRDDLMRLQLQKERLSSFVVHDLKNPVSSIDLLAQVLVRDKRLPPDARETAETIRVEVVSLMRLILNLLDINRGEEGELRPAAAPIHLPALVHAVVETCQPRAKARNIEIASALNDVTTIFGDADLLRRVLENLVENALRYAPPRSRVSVSAAHAEGAVELRVADQGKGIPEPMRAAVFDRFVQLGRDDRDGHRTGRGLGLTFCRLAIEAHGGRIFVEDAEPGAAFCVRLPADG